jgi:hypothetical protein
MKIRINVLDALIYYVINVRLKIPTNVYNANLNTMLMMENAFYVVLTVLIVKVLQTIVLSA